MHYVRYVLPDLIQGGWPEVALTCIDGYLGAEHISASDRQVLFAWRMVAMMLTGNYAGAADSVISIRAAIAADNGKIDQGVGMPLTEYSMIGTRGFGGRPQAVFLEVSALAEPAIALYRRTGSPWKYMLRSVVISQDDSGRWIYKYSGSVGTTDREVARVTYQASKAAMSLIEAAIHHRLSELSGALVVLKWVPNLELLQGIAGSERLVFTFLEWTVNEMRFGDRTAAKYLLAGFELLNQAMGGIRGVDEEIAAIRLRLAESGDPTYPTGVSE